MNLSFRSLALSFSLALVALPSVGCGASAPVAATAPAKAGSMARFIVHDGYLYALDQGKLVTYEAAPGLPVKIGAVALGADAETLFPYGKLLFVGTRQGMLVYSLEDPEQPSFVGQARHVYSCDPVVVDKDIAFVTLRAENQCRAGQNELLVFDVRNPTQPIQIAQRGMSSPHGLGVDGSLLFIADKQDGLLLFDVTDPKSPQQIGRVANIAGYDLIAHEGILYVSSNDGLYQYEYGPEGITKIDPVSKVPIGDGTVMVAEDPKPTARLNVAR